MEYFPWIIGGIVVILVIWFIVTYNSLIRKKVYIGEAWSSIDVQLKRKGNILPNLVDTIKMQTDYEGELLEKLTAARSGLVSGTPQERIKESEKANKLLDSFYAVAENYPQLGANESFRQMMTEIADCEDKIAYSRNRYNVAVTSFNTAITVFPGLIVARLFGMKDETFYEIPEQSREDFDNMRIKDLK